MQVPEPQPNSTPDVMAVLEEFYLNHARELFFFCYRRLNDADAANDAVGRIILKALNRLDTFQPHPDRPGATLRAWVYAIARNDLIDLRRTGKITHSLDLEDASGKRVHNPQDPARSPESEALRRDAERRVQQMLATLPENQRAIVELRLAGLSGNEIAQTLDLTLSAVKSAQFRAYQKLRTLLTEPEVVP